MQFFFQHHIFLKTFTIKFEIIQYLIKAINLLKIHLVLSFLIYLLTDYGKSLHKRCDVEKKVHISIVSENSVFSRKVLIYSLSIYRTVKLSVSPFGTPCMNLCFFSSNIAL